MKTRKFVLLFSLVLALVLQGCLPGATPQNVDQGAIDEAVQKTLVALSVFQTATAVAQQPEASPTALPVEASATPLPAPTETAAPPPTATAVPTEVPPQPSITPPPTIPAPAYPVASVSVNTNCRSGPSRFYELLGGLRVGETARVVGKYPAAEYWIIETPGRQGVCWLWGGYASINGDTGSLPVFEAPPPPPQPKLAVRSDTSCYAGPATTFTRVGILKGGRDAEIVGRDRYSEYWLIRNPDTSGNCWIAGTGASFSGNLDQVEFVTAPTPQATVTGYACTITERIADGTSFPVNADFDARWTVKNNGTKTWNAGEVDYRYQSGTEMHKYENSYDLKKTIAPGESITLIADMVAPAGKGSYSTTWVLKAGGDTVCNLPLSITVK